MESSSELPLVLVTGASGYFASWTITKLLESEKYRVRSTMTNKDDEEKLEPMRAGYGDNFDKIEIVNCDLLVPDDVKSAIKDCTYVIHIATPFPKKLFKNTHKDEIEPVIKGYLNVLGACVGSEVKKVVITSSAMTVQDHSKGEDFVADENHTVEERKSMDPHYKSKVRAEIAARKYMKELEKEKKKTFDVSYICQCITLGSMILPTANRVITGFFIPAINGKSVGAPQVYYGHSDVEDVADALINAIDKGEDDKKYVVCNKIVQMKEFVRIIKEYMDPKGYKVDDKELSKCLMWVGSFFNADAKNAYYQWGINAQVDGSSGEKLLGRKYTTMEKSLQNFCDSLIEHKLIKEPKK